MTSMSAVLNSTTPLILGFPPYLSGGPMKNATFPQNPQSFVWRPTETVPSPSTIENTALPLDWLLSTDKGTSLSERVLARLIQSEAHEPDVSFRDDIRIAFLIVLHCERGDAVECTPAELAWQQVLGKHPDRIYSAILARRAALLGSNGADGTPISLGSAPPKKSPQSVEDACLPKRIQGR